MDQEQQPNTPQDDPEYQVPVDEEGRPLLDRETGEPIHWATKNQRVAAWIAAIAVILITLGFVYSIYSGYLFFH